MKNYGGSRRLYIALPGASFARLSSSKVQMPCVEELGLGSRGGLSHTVIEWHLAPCA
jgi:hypothetical protein